MASPLTGRERAIIRLGSLLADERFRKRLLVGVALIILPVRNLVLFPGVILPITIGRAKSRADAYIKDEPTNVPALYSRSRILTSWSGTSLRTQTEAV